MSCRRCPCTGHGVCKGLASKGQGLIENANEAWWMWSKLRTNRLKYPNSNIPDAPSHTQPLPGAAPFCLAAMGSGEEHWKFLLVPKHKYIKLPCSTSTETFHMGEEKGENNNKRQLITKIGWGQRSVVISSRTKALPSLQSSPKEHFAAAEARTCCRHQNLLTAPKAAISRRPVLAPALFAHLCRG